jgi:hypothetical protein
MKPEIAAILTNPRLVAIDQDPLGLQGFAWVRTPELEVWRGRCRGEVGDCRTQPLGRAAQPHDRLFRRSRYRTTSTRSSPGSASATTGSATNGPAPGAAPRATARGQRRARDTAVSADADRVKAMAILVSHLSHEERKVRARLRRGFQQANSRSRKRRLIAPLPWRDSSVQALHA